MRIHIRTPDATPMDVALAKAFAAFSCEPLGGVSGDGWSGIANLQRCPYRYYLLREMKAVAVDPTDANLKIPAPVNLEVGSLFHAVLAVHYARRLPKGYPGYRENLPDPYAFLDAVEREGPEFSSVHLVRRLYHGYSEAYGPEDEIQPVAVEFEAGISGIHTCRYDALIWREDGLWNLETKTAAFETPEVLESWWLDGEIIGQSFAWELSGLSKAFGAPLRGTIINLAFKTTPARYRRMEIVVAPDVLAQFAEDRMYWNRQRESFRRAGRWPRSLAGCVSRYDRCGFWHHCRDMDNSLIQIQPIE